MFKETVIVTLTPKSSLSTNVHTSNSHTNEITLWKYVKQVI